VGVGRCEQCRQFYITDGEFPPEAHCRDCCSPLRPATIQDYLNTKGKPGRRRRRLGDRSRGPVQ